MGDGRHGTTWTTRGRRLVVGVDLKKQPGDARFFVILTFQPAEAPKVQAVRGEGLGATVRVGDQTVAFDGEKIVFGDGGGVRENKVQ